MESEVWQQSATAEGVPNASLFTLPSCLPYTLSLSHSSPLYLPLSLSLSPPPLVFLAVLLYFINSACIILQRIQSVALLTLLSFARVEREVLHTPLTQVNNQRGERREGARGVCSSRVTEVLTSVWRFPLTLMKLFDLNADTPTSDRGALMKGVQSTEGAGHDAPISHSCSSSECCSWTWHAYSSASELKCHLRIWSTHDVGTSKGGAGCGCPLIRVALPHTHTHTYTMASMTCRSGVAFMRHDEGRLNWFNGEFRLGYAGAGKRL